MARGGIRPGAGRKKGSGNTRTREIALKAMEGGITPLDYMLTVLRGEPPEGSDVAQRLTFESMRFEAAKAAAPYVHPRLNSIDIGNKDGKPFLIQPLPEDVGIL